MCAIMHPAQASRGRDGISRDNRTRMPNLMPCTDNPKDGYQMILVPAGEAIFGSREDDRGSDSDEKPRFRAYLPDYYLGKYPVRNVEYARFLDQVRPNDSKLSKWILLNSDCHVVKVGEGYRVREEDGVAQQEAGQGEHLESGWADHPVVQVSWWGAEAYCKWAGLRLPTELEWEKGARGVEGEVYPWGNEWDANGCRNSASKGSGRTGTVWAYPEGCSVWGHHQMAGNVWEWCGDWYESEAYRRYAKGDLTPPRSGTYRALRGGSWYDVEPASFRCAFRDRHFPGVRNYLNFGFRCAGDTRSVAEGLPESEPTSMTVQERIIAALRCDGPMCDDCLASALKLHWRQQANSICNQLASESIVLRERGWCAVHERKKLINTLRPGSASSAQPPSDPHVPAAPGDGYDPDRPWYWEGNVQARLVAWLRSQGYEIRRVADTASKQQGVDIIAVKNGKELWISVKGYPESRNRTPAPAQARHWFSGAVFDGLLYRDADPNVQLALAFPDLSRRYTYRRLASRMKWLRANLPLRIYWVTDSGEVIAE